MDRAVIVADLLACRDDLHRLLAPATPARLRARSNGTRWSNEQLLFHMVFGFLIVRRLLPLVRLMSVMPPSDRAGVVDPVERHPPRIHRPGEPAPHPRLRRGDLTGIVRARALSQATMSNIRQNLLFAFIYNAAGIPLAAGVLYPAFGLLLSHDCRSGHGPVVGQCHRKRFAATHTAALKAQVAAAGSRETPEAAGVTPVRK